ncbi:MULTISPECIES: hypothetical protein [Halorussus]|uniref:hypothetical protein n=1 Tax=Halorussus TaxID=1070314 RepID=UPI000E214485|nr:MULTISPECIES: hypothetical protein [Halorussus]NHN61220.1 hypothetical protein [Halorussus sp. JP-T4]
MTDKSSIPQARPISSYIEDGARIATILLIWGVISALFTYGVSDVGLPFERFWIQLGQLFAVTGVLNAVLYLLYRTIDYWHETL